MKIRPERPQDAKAIRIVTDAAFDGVPFSDQTEAKIVESLRANSALTVSLVAVENGIISGHVAFSPVQISGAHQGWYGLGPVSVKPDRQRKGIGKMLIRAGLDQLRAIDAAGCVVFGSPEYYGRFFGFKNDPALVYPGAPEGYFMCLCFRGASPKGEVTYDLAFGAT